MDNFRMNLQLFADGAGGEGAAAGDAGSGGNQQAVAAPERAKPTEMYAGKVQQDTLRAAQRPAQAVVSAQEPAKPTGDTTRAAAVDKAAEPPKKPTFQELIEGEYKDEYSKHTQGIVQKRLGPAKDAEARLTQFAPAIQAMAERLGLEYSDVRSIDPAALMKALDEDKSWIEQRALEEGVTTDQMERQIRLEREVSDSRAERAALEKARYESEMDAKAQEIKRIVPGFDWRIESMNNPTFKNLVENGFDMKKALYIAHMDEIEANRQAQIDQQMKSTAEAATAAAAKAVASGARRPAENGTAGAAAASAPKIDINKLKPKDFRELAARAARGEALPSSLFQA